MDEDDPLRMIEQARLLGLDDRRDEGRRILEELATQLAADPSAGEARRRVRWSLDALR